MLRAKRRQNANVYDREGLRTLEIGRRNSKGKYLHFQSSKMSLTWPLVRCLHLNANKVLVKVSRG